VKARGDKAKIRGIDFLKNRSPIRANERAKINSEKLYSKN
jgi:hypothetical protein